MFFGGKRACVFGGLFLYGGKALALSLLSPAFTDGGVISNLYADATSEVSPPLQWRGASRRTVSYVLIVDEPRDSGPNVVHWVIYNIPASWSDLPEDFNVESDERRESVQVGLNSWAKTDWTGVELKGAQLHFQLIAINRFLKFNDSPDALTVLSAIEDYIVDEGEISATCP
ncbi:YbhB/YbcL family Raf kinase inhibitor-like protein [Cerasicoccus arenae]|uniref:Phosphatidylethanolamine-binding protein n=1 Tax=Cerasicoccus arenae TaxID=424488 RepID=A0A8J3DJB6_9BACT|nr:YbhB/YbcL family Raf kinase inhibitor-like protein [Cerasicoccus arenae]MBK1858342.1 YbhB/YbcL family Raf kinase inhibitor-like protein [Cerasicoccus arenae]GHC09680.1 hypothetical protein GCM10007047_28710 [Cerasicoccus arenae]